MEKKGFRPSRMLKNLLIRVGPAPSLVPGLGAAILGALGSLTAYRPYFIVFTLVALILTYLRHYGWCVSRSWEKGFRAALACLWPTSEKDAGLIIASVFVLALIIAPPWSVTQYFKPANPCAVRLQRLNVSPHRPISQPLPAVQNPCAK